MYECTILFFIYILYSVALHSIFSALRAQFCCDYLCTSAQTQIKDKQRLNIYYTHMHCTSQIHRYRKWSAYGTFTIFVSFARWLIYSFYFLVRFHRIIIIIICYFYNLYVIFYCVCVCIFLLSRFSIRYICFNFMGRLTQFFAICHRGGV